MKNRIDFHTIPVSLSVLKARFLAKIKVADDCWLWTGAKLSPRRDQPIGYGYMVIQSAPFRVAVLAHRVSWEIYFGPVPGDMNVLHTCDNPPCVNPAHLFLGSQKKNMEDCVVKGRKRHSEDAPRAGFSNEQVADIKERLARGESVVSIASRYNKPHGTIWNISAGNSWRYLQPGGKA